MHFPRLLIILALVLAASGVSFSKPSHTSGPSTSPNRFVYRLPIKPIRQTHFRSRVGAHAANLKDPAKVIVHQRIPAEKLRFPQGDPSRIFYVCANRSNSSQGSKDLSQEGLDKYIAGIEALTGSIQDLDEAVQDIRSSFDACGGEDENSKQDECQFHDDQGRVYDDAHSTAPQPVESFTDSPDGNLERRRRDRTTEEYYGIPSTPTSTSKPVDTVGDDLTNATRDLEALRKQLNNTAEWLRQTNHTIHSVMMRALQAYVSSIERRVDYQRRLHSNFVGAGLIGRVALVRERIDILMERLRNLSPFNHVHVTREDQVSPAGFEASRSIQESNNVTIRRLDATTSTTTMLFP